jgi:hypothetical protein
MPTNIVISGTLGDINVAAAFAGSLLFPLSAQLDGLLTFALGPLQADLAAQFNATLAAQATLTLQIGDPTAALQLALSALAQLQAALQAALQLPPVNLSLSAELTASAALIATLKAKLGLIDVLIKAALQIKASSLKFGGELQAALGASAVLVTFSGTTLAVAGDDIKTLFDAGVPPIGPGSVSGIIIVAETVAGFTASLDFLFGATPPPP